ncbi:MAG: ROK family protein [Acidimicrobiales bacterium]
MTGDLANCTLGADIGGTHFRMGLCLPDGTVIRHETLQTAGLRSAHEGLSELAHRLDPNRETTSAVLGVPGVIDYEQQSLLYAPNLPTSFLKELSGSATSQILERKVSLVNDADLAGIGEFYFGAGRNSTTMGYVTFSTGVGAAVISQGKLLRARYSLAELGHSFLDLNSATQDGEGSVELLASGTALQRAASKEGLSLTNPELLALLRSREERSETVQSILAQIAHAAACALVNMVYLFALDTIVVGGGLSLASPELVAMVTESFQRLRPQYLDTAVVLAELGDNAGLGGVGAVDRAFS